MSKLRSPFGLSPESRRWYKRIQDEYQIADQGGLLILQTSMEAFDRMRSAQTTIKKDGLTFLDKAGQIKSHPLCSVERDARSQMMAALKSLNLDLEPLKNIGRPGGK